MIHKLYSLVDTEVKTKEPLYIQGVNRRSGDIILLNKGEVLDFTTYFNSVSLKKWKRYTTIERLQLVLHLKGHFQVTFHFYDENKTVHKIAMKTYDSVFVHSFSMAELNGALIGFTIQCLSEEGAYMGGEWDGQFSQWNERKIGISITTFKREKYVKRTMNVLQDFQRDHPWLSVLVVDNGSTLQEINDTQFRVIHNRNYGGSGGFTRGMIEYVEQGKVDYVLLMDDDIVLETSALERTFSLLSGVKKEYEESFLAGAMLSMEKPCLQSENTAYWDKIISRICNKNMNLSVVKNLIANETVHSHPNTYAGWWYCCIPSKRIVEIGYPLPVFIKSDDMEYGIRNNREIISLNGIGIWHQAFVKKMNLAIRYFSDRNSFILNHYAQGCNRGTLVLAVLGRIGKRLIHCDTHGIAVLSLALKSYSKGFESITANPADKVFFKVRQHPFDEGLAVSIIGVIGSLMRSIIYYHQIDKKYTSFRKIFLSDSIFWKRFLNLRGKNE